MQFIRVPGFLVIPDGASFGGSRGQIEVGGVGTGFDCVLELAGESGLVHGGEWWLDFFLHTGRACWPHDFGGHLGGVLWFGRFERFDSGRGGQLDSVGDGGDFERAVTSQRVLAFGFDGSRGGMSPFHRLEHDLTTFLEWLAADHHFSRNGASRAFEAIGAFGATSARKYQNENNPKLCVSKLRHDACAYL